MKRLMITAATALGTALNIAAPAHAGWLETRTHTIVDPFTEAGDNLSSAKTACHARGGAGVTPAYTACMKAAGFIWQDPTPEEIAEGKRRDAISSAAADQADEEARARARAAWGAAVGQAATELSRSLNPPIITCRHLYGGVTQCQ